MRKQAICYSTGFCSVEPAHKDGYVFLHTWKTFRLLPEESSQHINLKHFDLVLIHFLFIQQKKYKKQKN